MPPLALLQRNESDLFLNLLQRFSGSTERLFSALFHAVFKVALIGEHTLELSLHGGEHICDSLADCSLEIAVALAVELTLDVLETLVGDCGIDGHEIDYSVLALASAHNGFAVGDCTLELADNCILIVEYPYAGVGVLV